MAEKIEGEKGTKSGRKAKKDDNGPAGIGHNMTALRKVAKPAFERLDRLFNEMESQAGEFRADIKTLYEECANEIGCKRSILRKVYGQYRRARKDEAAEKEMESSELEELEALRDSMGFDSPFGAWASQKAELAKASPAKAD